MKTRNYYLRHWCYVVIGRSLSLKSYSEIAIGLDDYRKNIDKGLFAEKITDSATFNVCYIIYRKVKPLRYDAVCRAFPRCYVTRLPSGQKPSEAIEKWAMKHSTKADPVLIHRIDKKTSIVKALAEEVTDDYMIEFDKAIGEVNK